MAVRRGIDTSEPIQTTQNERRVACTIEVLPKRCLHDPTRCDAAGGAVLGEALSERSVNVRVESHAFIAGELGHGALPSAAGAPQGRGVLRTRRRIARSASGEPCRKSERPRRYMDWGGGRVAAFSVMGRECAITVPRYRSVTGAPKLRKLLASRPMRRPRCHQLTTGGWRAIVRSLDNLP